MLNNKAIAKLINAKRLEIEAIDELLPESVREKKNKLTEKVKSTVMEIAAEVCAQNTSESGSGNTSDRPHKVNIDF